MSKSLEGKIAIVTGGSRGIGAAIALEFARRGASGVTITYQNNVSAANTIVSKIKMLGSSALAIKVDISTCAQSRETVEKTMEFFETDAIDILVNNAAIMELRGIDSITPDDIWRTMTTNFAGPLLMVQAVLPFIRRGGRIINLSSRLARAPSPGGVYVYAASKAALENFTRNLATEWAAQKGITVNNVMPGATDTDGLKTASLELIEKLKAMATAENRLGSSLDVANVVAFLSEAGSSWINGDTISVTGGAIMF